MFNSIIMFCLILISSCILSAVHSVYPQAEPLPIPSAWGTYTVRPLIRTIKVNSYKCKYGETHAPNCPKCLCTHFILEDGRVIKKGEEVVNDYIVKRPLKFQTIKSECTPGKSRIIGRCWVCTCRENGVAEECVNQKCED